MNPVVAIQLGMVIAVGAAAAFRLGRWVRAPAELSNRALFFALVCFDAGLLLGFPAFFDLLYRLLGNVPALPQLFQHAATMGAVYYTQVLTLAIATEPERANWLRTGLRQRRIIVLLGLAVLVVCYASGPLRLGLRNVGVAGYHDITVAAYVAVAQLYASVTLADIARTSWANRTTDRPFRRIGLRLTAIGCAFGVLFCLHKTLYFVATAAGLSLPWDESGTAGIQQYFLVPAVLCLLVGIVLPFAGPRFVVWRRRRTAYRQLAPLADALRAAAPASATVEASALRGMGMHARLLNRVIGIRDCLVGPLRNRLHIEVYDTAYERCVQEGLAPDDAKAFAEAACISAAVSEDSAVTVPHALPPFHHGSDLDSEAHWLARVSRSVRAVQPATAPGRLLSWLPSRFR